MLEGPDSPAMQLGTFSITIRGFAERNGIVLLRVGAFSVRNTIWTTITKQEDFASLDKKPPPAKPIAPLRADQIISSANQLIMSPWST